ncbi:MAG: hypothetical protein ACR2NN_03905 [Bryobacteraceae bacterium]
MRALLYLLAGVCSAATVGQDVDVKNIIRRSAAAMDKDWNAAPGFLYIERDVQSKRNGPQSIKTYQVLLIAGSNYNRLIAINDQPLAADQIQQEQEKLQREIAKRQHESSSERARRVAKYQKERRQDHAMIAEMAKAFTFRLTGSDRLDGHDCWVFDATPDPAYQPRTRDTKVLPGMKGKLWVEKEHYQWAKVEGEVIRPVSFYGVFAKVSPGTKFVLEQAPVTSEIWLPTHFSMKVNASALGFISENSTDDETYRDYKPISATAMSQR